jgi:hypothetical protein
MYCAGAHQAELHAAGCASSEIAGFCSVAPAPPPAPPSPPVDCSAKGSCFNISGAKNTAKGLPSGIDLNGLYAKTAHACNGKDVWQKGGGGGPVLFLDGYSYWRVGPSERATDCSGSTSDVYLYSVSECPSNPDGAGCAGEWYELDSNDRGHRNPALRVVASGGR